MQDSSTIRPAVYLHGGWRCASTYIWSRFRDNRFTTCFYEPFSERLARCTARRIERDTAGGWNSRHPQLKRPYREEYLPLLGWPLKGVPGYREDFALARYFPRADGVGSEARYLARLARQAADQGTRAVFGFSRSLGRAAMLKQALGGYHVLVRRDPRQQWLSCRSYREQVALWYFELCHFLILALAPEGSPARGFADVLGLPLLPRGLERQFRTLHAAIHPWDDAMSYRAFTAVWLLSHGSAEPAADLLLDVDRLGRSQAYRESARARILEETGLAVNFGDCRVPTHDPAAVAIDYALIERDVGGMLRCLGAEVAPEPRAVRTASA